MPQHFRGGRRFCFLPQGGYGSRPVVQTGQFLSAKIERLPLLGQSFQPAQLAFRLAAADGYLSAALPRLFQLLLQLL